MGIGSSREEGGGDLGGRRSGGFSPRLYEVLGLYSAVGEETFEGSELAFLLFPTIVLMSLRMEDAVVRVYLYTSTWAVTPDE